MPSSTAFLRLAHQGIEYLTTGRLVLPVPDPFGARLRDLRTGRVPLADALAEAEAAEGRLKDLLTTSPLREHPGVERVEAFLIRACRERWGWVEDEELRVFTGSARVRLGARVARARVARRKTRSRIPRMSAR